MANLVEAYSLSTGLKINKPYLYETYFPTPDKYITLQNSSGMDSKNYSYWNEVVELILPELNKRDIKIVQLGDGSIEHIEGCLSLGGATNFNQTAYIVKKSMLHTGNDSWLMHLAPSLGVPVVGLYGPTAPSNHGPYFSEKGKTILIESHRKGLKPSFSSVESPKTIDYILPEDVANGIFKLLNIDTKINRETLYIGPHYKQKVYHIIPDSPFYPTFMPNEVLNARMDYHFDEGGLFYNLAMRKLTIITNKPISIEGLLKFKDNIVSLVYEVDENYNLEFLSELKRSGIQYLLMSKKEPEWLNTIKLEFMDYGIIHNIHEQTKLSKKDIDNSEKIGINSVYKSNKFLLSKGKIYLNKTDWINDDPIPSFKENTKPVNFEDENFRFNINSYYIYNQ